MRDNLFCLIDKFIFNMFLLTAVLTQMELKRCSWSHFEATFETNKMRSIATFLHLFFMNIASNTKGRPYFSTTPLRENHPPDHGIYHRGTIVKGSQFQNVKWHHECDFEGEQVHDSQSVGHWLFVKGWQVSEKSDGSPTRSYTVMAVGMCGKFCARIFFSVKVEETIYKSSLKIVARSSSSKKQIKVETKILKQLNN